MPVAEGFVIEEQDVVGVREDGDTAEVRTTIDAAHGCERLEQRVLRFAPGRSLERGDDDRQEALYVVAGCGTLNLAGVEHELEPETGVFIAPGERYTVDNAGSDELMVVSVTAPESEHGIGATRRVLVRYAEQPALPASPNREFRYLVNQEAGCLDMTQFVGVIPPSRAPLHSHTYDEVVFVLEGDGVYHIGEDEIPLGPGTCIHLPPLVLHCLENIGTTDMRVLGVFHPSGDPASRAKIEAQVDNKEGM
jgi:mannose-6-phosphate isomerase-like protein (cupin superfamily)